ncbi:protein-disulfide reductase DsbD family protein [Sphingobium algorifonticola]|uniref:Thiol:disulfide interchange protein n=1 Tax=Sphingobium algorifonticola TaxID=2008318 RepID=A0A437J5P4_9SPHN|nr:thioredoxin family protein [Sphingobium algorifonticola]RVT40255.1 thiol:disulfide interchange protein [Sphingobium algorifonticola]
MRTIYVLLMTLTLLVTGVPATAQIGAFGGAEPNIAASLVAESAAPAPGKPVTLAFVMTPRAGWHGYWENPGDAGIGMSVKWTLPAGVTAGPLRHPVPETLIISGLMNYVYEGQYAILVTLNVPATAKPGDRLPIRVRGDWLACTREICVPGGGDLALDLTVGSGTIAAADRSRFDQFRARLPRPLGSEGRFAVENGQFRLAIPYPASASLADAYFFPMKDDAFAYAAPQTITRSGDMVIVEGKAAGGPAATAISGILRTADHVGFAVRAVPGTVASAGDGAEGTGVGAILLALGGALLGGLLLNIMPCVFPILSLKALSLAKAGGDARAARREALAYAAGVVVTCLALGAVLLALRAGGASVGWAFQLQDPRIILLLLVLVTAIAFNLAGLFELQAVGAGGALAAKGGVQGSFWTGVLVAFVATPCTGPFMAAALGAALVLPVGAALAIFAGLGLGLALPFLLIGFMPALRARMPRPGPWMKRFQRLLSIPMFVTALALAWLLGQQMGTGGMTIGLATAMAAALLLWWLGGRQRAGRGGLGLVALGIAALLAGGIVTLPQKGVAQASSLSGDGRTVPFDEARLAQLRAQGKPVFLYFTADWCLTCKVNEAAAIDRADVAEAFEKAGVVTMVGDWTNSDPAIGRFLEAQGRSGVPLYLFYPVGQNARALPQVLTPAILTALVG